jgi:hypothetical protein
MRVCGWRCSDDGSTIGPAVPPSLNDLAVSSPHAALLPSGRPAEDIIPECKRAVSSVCRVVLELHLALQGIVNSRAEGRYSYAVC